MSNQPLQSLTEHLESPRLAHEDAKGASRELKVILNQDYIHEALEKFSAIWEVPIEKIKMAQGHKAKNKPVLESEDKQVPIWLAHDNLPFGEMVTFYSHG